MNGHYENPLAWLWPAALLWSFSSDEGIQISALGTRKPGCSDSITGEMSQGYSNVASVDVEDYFHAEIFSDVVERDAWSNYTSRVEVNTRRLLEVLARLNVHATFFILGWVAERFPALVREIAAGGHELGCHSYWHRLIYKLDPAEFREDTHRAKSVIEQISGEPVRGYRAPTYSVVDRSAWALEVLAELGFSYDSSIFPIRHDRYGMPDAPRAPFHFQTPSGPMTEFPITTFRIAGHNFPVGGGGYLRLLPWFYTQIGVQRAKHEGLPIVTYIHPWEIDPEQPRLTGRLTSRLRHYANLSRTLDRFQNLLQSGTFTSFRESGLADSAKDFDFYAWNRLKN
jgi:polysaccharide deacetylase family protein (PEP-CTERM system associated)